MVFVGLEGAGKTSIISRVFKFFTTEEITRLTPTVLMDASLFSLKIIRQPIAILDLGGQEQFLTHHLKNSNIFTDSKIIIYVVDVQRLDRLNKVLQYFAQVKAIVQASRQSPREFLLLHKYDKSKKDELSFLLPTILTRLLDVLGNDITFFMTSIYDDSLFRVFTYILSFLFPIEVISQGLSHELTAKLLPTIIQISTSQLQSSITKKTARVYNYMKAFGKIITNSIVQRNWYFYFLKQLQLTNVDEFPDNMITQSIDLSKNTENIDNMKNNFSEDSNSYVFLNLLDENTISFDVKMELHISSESPPKKSTKSDNNDEFLATLVLTIAFQGLIKGFCDSMGCRLRLLSLIPQVNTTKESFQLEGVVKCH